MADQWILLLVALGLVVGALGTLIGAGGGFLLTPVLLLVYPHASAQTISATSLAVVFANAASGTVAYARQGRVDYRSCGASRSLRFRVRSSERSPSASSLAACSTR